MSRRAAGARPDAHQAWQLVNLLGHHPGEVRQQQLQAAGRPAYKQFPLGDNDTLDSWLTGWR